MKPRVPEKICRHKRKYRVFMRPNKVLIRLNLDRTMGLQPNFKKRKQHRFFNLGIWSNPLF